MTDDLVPYTDDKDATLPPRDWDKPQIEMGTIGWEDEDVWYEKGTEDNDGLLLVRVQLYRGRNFTRDIKPQQGQGHQILCVMSTIFGHRVPPKGARCYVAVPFGFDGNPGSACIIAIVEKNPFFQFNGATDGTDGLPRAMFGDDTQHIVIRGKSVTLTGPDDCFLQVGTGPAGGSPAIVAQDTEGAGYMISKGAVGICAVDNGDATSAIQLSPSSIDIMQKDGSSIQFKGGDSHWMAANAYIMGAGIYLGLGATAAAAVAYKPPASGPGPAVNASATVYVSP